MKKYALIGVGGMAGAAARYSAAASIHLPAAGLFPANTLLVNMTGCFLLAALLTLAFEIWEMDPALRLGIAAGLLGAFTTFSALCREAAALIGSGHWEVAAVYVALSTGVGAFAVWLGIAAARGTIRLLAGGGGTR